MDTSIGLENLRRSWAKRLEKLLSANQYEVFTLGEKP